MNLNLAQHQISTGGSGVGFPACGGKYRPSIPGVFRGRPHPRPVGTAEGVSSHFRRCPVTTGREFRRSRSFFYSKPLERARQSFAQGLPVVHRVLSAAAGFDALETALERNGSVHFVRGEFPKASGELPNVR